MAQELKLILCEWTLYMRERSVRLRSWVGIEVEIPVYGWLWAGASTKCFLDGPLLVISSLIILPRLCHAATAMLWSYLTHRPTTERPGAGPTNKVKNE